MADQQNLVADRRRIENLIPDSLVEALRSFNKLYGNEWKDTSISAARRLEIAGSREQLYFKDELERFIAELDEAAIASVDRLLPSYVATTPGVGMLVGDPETISVANDPQVAYLFIGQILSQKL